MSPNQSDSNTLPNYKLYFDDIEELFLNTISFKCLFISTITAYLLTIVSVILLLYRSRTLFLACLIPFIYALIFYDLLQLLSINLLKINLLNVNEKFFSELCRWPYYFKASAEAGQCLTLIFFYAIRCQKVQYFLKHKHLLNSSHVHYRALTLVCLLFIVYANNWITHLKIEKIHLITIDESKYEINIQEYPMPLYGINDVKLNDRQQFYSDFDKYAQNYEKNQTRQTPSEKIIHNQKGGTVHEIIIKIPYNNFFAQPKPSEKNRTRQKSKKKAKVLNKTIENKNSYRIHRCTYGQRNFVLTNLWFLIHSIFYLVSIIYFLTTTFHYKIPLMAIDYHQKLHDQSLSIGRRKSADHHKQLMLLTHLRHFQYYIIYCHTTFILIRLIYVCLLTIILFLFHTPFQWLPLKIFFYALFLIVYYSIPIRLTFLFLYLFISLFSSYIYSIFYYIFHTKLHFSCKLQKPNIRFHLHIVPYNNQRDIHHDEHSTNSLVLDLTSSVYDEHSTILLTESNGINEENSSSQNAVTTNSFLIANEFEHTKL